MPRGARRWRVAAYEAEEVVASLRSRGVRYGAARAMLPQSLAHRILVKMELAGDSPDDRVQDAVARSKPVKDYAKELWPAVDPARLVWRLLAEPDFLASRGRRDPRAGGAGGAALGEAAALPRRGPRGRCRTPYSSTRRRTWSSALPSLAHIVVDEAQDLSPMMLRALARRSSTGSLTVLGDLAQATTPWATRTWAEALAHLGKPDAHVEELTLGFRVPGDVIEYAARLLPVIAPGLTPPTSVRRARGDLSLVTVSGPLAEAVVANRCGR